VALYATRPQAAHAGIPLKGAGMCPAIDELRAGQEAPCADRPALRARRLMMGLDHGGQIVTDGLLGSTTTTPRRQPARRQAGLMRGGGVYWKRLYRGRLSWFYTREVKIVTPDLTQNKWSDILETVTYRLSNNFSVRRKE